MGKYISTSLYNGFSKKIKNLPRKIDIYELWDKVGTELGIEDAEMTVNQKIASMSFHTTKNEYHVELPAKTVIVTSENGDTKEENYDLLLSEGLEQIIEKEVNKKKKEEKPKRKYTKRDKTETPVLEKPKRKYTRHK